MKGRQTTAVIAALVFAFSLATTRLHAFALIGPFADWMDVTNDFRHPGDIGGPMEIGEAYRWNVPVVTYGFDQSFLDYFGSNGVQAVEAAIQIINDLPPASVLTLTNYPNNSGQNNYTADADGLWDLKSATLSALVEQLGLAQPTRYICSIRRWDDSLKAFTFETTAGPPWPAGTIAERNFDPLTLIPSYYVNGTLYAAFIQYFPFGTSGVPYLARTVPFIVDPLDTPITAVADANSLSGPTGRFYTGLTYDDAGGFKFLLATNNLRVESLLPEVNSPPPSTGIVRTATRPGVDKITFLRHPTDPVNGRFLAFTNDFSDNYYLNGVGATQAVERITHQPDFLFSAADNSIVSPAQTLPVLRTGTSNWVNNAATNGGTNGPGVIAPPVRITFHRTGPFVFSTEPSPGNGSAQFSNRQWGSFDQSTNVPISYPNFAAGSVVPLSVRFRLSNGPNILLSQTWQLPVPIGGTAQLQTATNLTDWVSVMTVTNNGAVVEWYHSGMSSSQRFFRVSQK
jgi:hypothetical protein